jgi:hypothetical protein
MTITVTWQCSKCDFSYQEIVTASEAEEGLYPDEERLSWLGSYEDENGTNHAEQLLCQTHYREWQDSLPEDTVFMA